MKKQNDETIKQVIRRIVGQKKFKPPYYRYLVKRFWEQEMNSMIKQSTDSLDLRGDTLIIRLTSAPLKQELFYHKEALISKINRYLGEEYIQEVKLI